MCILKLSCIPRAVAWMCLVPACCAWGQASSEEEDLAAVFGDKASVSIATGRSQPLRRAPAVATVITAQDIAAMGAVDLDEVLEAVPGVHVSRSNQAYNPLYVIRGVYSEFNPQTLVLQNGVPMTTLFVGNRGIGWGGLPLENIARIEIIRGPGSALYGADAFSGVVNIITKNAADISGTEVGLRLGSFDSRDGWVQHGGKLGPVELAAYLRLGHSDGYKEIIGADAQTSLDQIFGGLFGAPPASLAPGPVSTGYDAVDGGLDVAYQKLRLRIGYKLRRNQGLGAGIAAALDPVGKSRTERTHADLSWNDIDIGKDWRLGLTASAFHYTQDFSVPLQIFPPGAFLGSFPNGVIGAPRTWERQIRLSAVATYSGFVNHNLRMGVGHDDLNLYKTQELKNFSLTAALPAPTPGGAIVEFPVSASFLAPHRRKVSYLYVQDEWNFSPDWTLTGGVRSDHYSDFGNTTNPRLALVWDASLRLTAKLLFGRAFRAPAYTEQYSINNPVIKGNPSLQPETIGTWEAAFTWQARSDTQLNLSLFRYRMKDIIRTSDAGAGTTMFNNIGAQRGHGMEFEAIWDASRNLRLSGHYAYQRSIDEASDQDAGYAPHHHLFGRADWSLGGGWLFSGQVNHVAGRKRSADDVRTSTIPDYTTMDLTLRTGRGKGRWDFAASVRNLFDADVREPSLAPGLTIPNDLPMAGRSLYLQAIYRL